MIRAFRAVRFFVPSFSFLCFVLLGALPLSLAACGHSDSRGLPPVSLQPGSGDPMNYYPWSQGNAWISRGTVTGAGTAEFYTLSRIAGTRTVNGHATTVWSKIRIKRPAAGPVTADRKLDSYLAKTGSGITFWGNDDERDALTPSLVPYPNAVFPFAAGSSFVQLARENIAFGTGTVDVHSVVTVRTTGQVVSLPLGTFSSCMSVDTDMVLKSSTTTTARQTMWYAPGVGAVKSTTNTIVNGTDETVSEHLIGYLLDGMATGVTPSTMSMTASGATGTGSVGRDGALFFLVPGVVPGQTYLVDLAGMTVADSANLHTFNGGNKCSNVTGSPAKSCGITGPEAVLYIVVDGFSISAEAAPFSVTVRRAGS